MASPFEEVAVGVKTIFDVEFAPEGFTMIPDNLHESLGRQRVEVGIAPIEDLLMSGNDIVRETWVEVRFFGLWTQEIDPTTLVNPALITGYAERFRNALGVHRRNDPGTGQVWYYDLRRITYPNDPTGNKSRFVATIRAFGNNSGLVETIA